MRIFLLSLVLVLVGCASGNNQPSTPSQPEIESNVMVCVHKYDANLNFRFREDNVRVYEQEMFGNVVRIYEIFTIDGQTIHLNDAQRYNSNCFYP